MPISPSRRTEILKLMARLSGASREDGRAAAARLLVIGSPAVPYLAEMAAKASPPGSSRALQVLVCLGDSRTRSILSDVVSQGVPEARVAAVELLAAFPDPVTVPLLEAAAAEPALHEAGLVALHVLARAGVSGAAAAFSRVLHGGAAPSAESILARAERLERLLQTIPLDPLAAEDEAAEREPASSPFDRYLELEPDSEEELALRREVAAGTPVEQVAARLRDEPDPRRLSLLALLAAEMPRAQLLPALKRVVELSEHPPRGREMVAAGARAHLALATCGSRIAGVELTRAMQELPAESLRVEHLRAVELVGGRVDVPRLAALSARPDWLGDAARRVLHHLMAREGITARSAVIKALPPEQRLVLFPRPAAPRRGRRA